MSAMDLETMMAELSQLSNEELAVMFGAVLSEIGGRGELAPRLAALEVIRCDNDADVNNAMGSIIFDLGDRFTTQKKE
jgi:hypothetical protein